MKSRKQTRVGLKDLAREVGVHVSTVSRALNPESGHPVAPELIELPPARELEAPCVVRGTAGDGEEVVYFHGHFDVVPAQARSQFEPVRADAVPSLPQSILMQTIREAASMAGLKAHGYTPPRGQPADQSPE